MECVGEQECFFKYVKHYSLCKNILLLKVIKTCREIKDLNITIRLGYHYYDNHELQQGKATWVKYETHNLN